MNRSRHWLIGIGCCWMVSGCSLLPFSITITPSNTETSPQETSEAPSPDTTTETGSDPATEIESVAATSPNTAEADAATPKSRPNYFREAVTRAESAVAIGQAAQSSDDWRLAASRWQQAVQYMQQVPTDDPNHATAQQKVKEYGQNLALAEQRAAGKGPTQPQSTSDRPAGLVASIPIVETMGGIPVVPVKLQGNRSTQEFTMLFDTGASGTLITQEMANAIGVVVTSEALVTVADGRQVRIPVGYVSSLQVGELVVENVWVGIGGDAGLLGQDVYGQYGISIGGSQINLYE